MTDNVASSDSAAWLPCGAKYMDGAAKYMDGAGASRVVIT